jgi:tight adherence protein B
VTAPAVLVAAVAPVRTAAIVGAAVALVVAAVQRATGAARHRAAQQQIVASSAPARARTGRVPRAVTALLPPTPSWVARRVRRAGAPASAIDRWWRSGLGASIAAVVLTAVVGGPGAAVLVAALAPLVVVLALASVGDRAAVLVDRELPLVLATVAAGVRSGASLPLAVREGAARARGPAGEDLAMVADSLAAGRGLLEVLDAWTHDRPTPGVRMAGAALALAAETGGAGARTIDGVASTLRDRVAVDRELAALSSQARASAVVIGVAPIGFVGLIATSDPGIWDFLLRTPAGLACLAAGCLLDGLGAAWMLAVARGPR